METTGMSLRVRTPSEKASVYVLEFTSLEEAELFRMNVRIQGR